jgi:cytochrome P450
MIRLRKEIDQVLGVRQEITFNDINNLKYCSYVFKEVLRLYPSLVFFNRITLEEMTINGYKIPAYTKIGV